MSRQPHSAACTPTLRPARAVRNVIKRGQILLKCRARFVLGLLAIQKVGVDNCQDTLRGPTVYVPPSLWDCRA